jgi:2,4-dienoyl-CoA reductase-like NADH-dependent reductase (Old Yellow Enzyme family)
MSTLFSSLRIRSLTLKNRLAVSPMCQYSSQDGFASDWHLVHLGSRAVGGAAIVFTEATAVSPDGRISPFDLGIWKDDHMGPLKRITDFIQEQGSIPGIQLAHAGRKASHSQPWKGNRLLAPKEGGWKTTAPSSIPFSPETDVPEALSKEGISKIIEEFQNAASRAFKAGFKITEIHAAHGYLLNQFLSSLSNKRTDEYGGSFENRIRLLLEVTVAVKKVWPPELPLFVRISATDWLKEGWHIEDSVKLATLLHHLGVDLIDCSSGGIVPDITIPVSPGYQVPLAEQIRKQSGIMTGAVGLISGAKQAEAIIDSGQADIILMAREFLRDPYFPLRAAHELDVDINWPVQYSRAKLKNK